MTSSSAVELAVNCIARRRRGATEDEEQRAFDTLHERYAPKALEIILEMGCVPCLDVLVITLHGDLRTPLHYKLIYTKGSRYLKIHVTWRFPD